MTGSTSLILLHTTKFGENSMVLHTLSREYGRRGFVVRSLNKKMMSMLLPMNILEVTVADSGKSGLLPVRNLMVSCPLMGIRSNLYKNTMTMFLSEVLYRVVKEGTDEPGLYEWCEKQIMLLDAIETDFSNFHIRFLLELAIALGFSPKIDDLRPFLGDNQFIIEKFMSTSFAESMLMPLSGFLRNEICEGVLRYIEYHSESTLTINSLKVLRELFI
jgi:DNA repair protein RecO (recombination protein O)